MRDRPRATGWRRGPPGFLLTIGTTLGLCAACHGPGPVERLAAHLELRSGNVAYLDGEYERAIEHYDALLERRPGLPVAVLNRGYAHLALYRLARDDASRRRSAEEAIRSFEAYLATPREGRPSDGPSRERLEDHMLNLLLGTGQRARAVSLLQAKLDGNPGDVATIHTMIGLCEESADVPGSARWLRRLIELEPNDPAAHYRFGVFAWRVSYYGQLESEGERDALVDEGLAALETALGIDPAHADSLVYTNLLYREKAKSTDDPRERRRYEQRADEFYARAMALKETT